MTKRNYLLLTPGPLSTSESVKRAMLQDWCTWDKDYNEGVVTVIRRKLLEIAGLDEKEYTTVLLQGSGTYGVEATLGATVRPEDKLLIVANGAYGKRMATIADYYHLNYVLVSLKETELVTPEMVERALDEHPGITHFSVVHSETTTGLLNPIEGIAEVLRGRGITWIVDAMSSFGGIPIDIRGLGIDFLISSANKCIQGVPRIYFHPCPAGEIGGVQRSGAFPVFGHLRPMGRDGTRAREMAFYFTDPCGACFLSGIEGIGGRRGDRSPLYPLLPQPPRVGGRHGGCRFPDIVVTGEAITHYHFFPLSGCRFLFYGVLRCFEAARVCHLSGQGFGCRYIPHRNHRGCLS